MSQLRLKYEKKYYPTSGDHNFQKVHVSIFKKEHLQFTLNSKILIDQILNAWSGYEMLMIFKYVQTN